ncbi:pirin-like bicupin family protein [Mycobacterium sp. 1274756.6]|uniref:pirin family protein n=1 Tax=Mycobacterium sp. 1274756.6 TaxID=1834076 RepID=UPI00080221F6|nr:pirin-like bicupin family protein [Mycobacterium sp. 1274756.6]OBJ73957.1 quercetin 2,3-dioxygenase [Mycobacterium sp. 1274756.6]
MTAPVEVRRAADRTVTQTPWLTSTHSFSFGDYYDPGNTHHGVLLVHNEDVVAPDSGYDTHPHRDMEILTWVLAGELSHRDSLGNAGVIYPGLAQRMSAGAGIEHSERNESSRTPVHFVQMWVLPDRAGGPPGYQQAEVDDALRGGDLVPIASGLPDRPGAITIGNRNVALHAARLRPGRAVVLPDARYLHLYVTRGCAKVADVGTLEAGDALRATAAAPGPVTADADAEILVWEMRAGLGD